MIKTKPLHQRINWPDNIDLSKLAYGIYRGLYGYMDNANFSIGNTDDYFRSHRFYTSNYRYERMAAMWYAVMRTALETYGLKS